MLILPVEPSLQRLLEQEDTDGDRRITVRDRGPKSFSLPGGYEVRGSFALSLLLQRLAQAQQSGLQTLELSAEELEETPVAHLQRTIRERCWTGLTRDLGGARLAQVLADQKGDGVPRLYVPAGDDVAWRYYSKLQADLEFKLIRLPGQLSLEFLTGLNRAPGLLSLASDREGTPLPYLVPGGRFNEMYGWDSYFIALGLLQDGKLEAARYLVDHFCYQLRHYGMILNANRTYYLTRSQPPFLTSMALAVAKAWGETEEALAWLRPVLELAAWEYEQVWLGPTRHVVDCGLSRYFCVGVGMPPETLMRHYGQIMSPHAERAGLSLEEFRKAYQSRQLVHPLLDAYFSEDRAVRESGHDTSYRLEARCTRLCPFELNCLLLRYETDLSQALTRYYGDQRAPLWTARAEARRARLQELCWDEAEGQFFDYDWVSRRRQPWDSATNLFGLWAGVATPAQAERMLTTLLPLLEQPGGLASGSLRSRGELSATRTPRQWDYPYGWAPHQMICWEGFSAYQYPEVAARLAFAWLRTITQNAADFNGVIAEKYDVVKASHEVFAEYVNVGADFAYFSEEGFGWTNASYQVGLPYLTSSQRAELEAISARDSQRGGV